MELTNASNGSVFAIVNNIPSCYHSSDLRNYFSQFIESKGFNCFHFKHRPESRVDETLNTNSSERRRGTFCCVVKVSSMRFTDFTKMYHKRHWLDRNGDIMPALCFISKIRVSGEEPGQNNKYKTRAEQKCIPENREQFSRSDLEKMQELHPPQIMPNGNVGTPTSVFLEFIKQCRLPPVIIKKLGLSFPKTRSNKKYGNVPFDYGGTVSEAVSNKEPEVVTFKGHEIPKENQGCDLLQQTSVEPSLINKNIDKHNFRKDPETKRRLGLRIEEDLIGKEDKDLDDDNDTCEEWERHEAFYDDPSNQERNSERLFEEEIELKWEKGGSGLVFYTDAQYWKELEGDFDEQTTDDLDVDMSVYYEEGAGDKDARDYIKMRQELRRRNGEEETDRFTAGIARKRPKFYKNVNSSKSKIGKFEQHTKGIGRKILTQQGWSEGKGLGLSVRGITEALEGEGQTPQDKTGFGFRGPKIVRTQSFQPKKKHSDVLISTKYDNPSDTDPPEALLRRRDPYHIKHRHSHHVSFTHSQTKE